MSNQRGAEFEALLMHLLSPSSDSQQLAQAATNPQMEEALASLAPLFSWADDPAWLEAVAAAREGLLVPEVEEFLEEKAALSNLAPELVTEFEALNTVVEDVTFLPSFPTLAQQWKAEEEEAQPEILPPILLPNWIREVGFQWQRLKESGGLLIQLLGGSSRPSPLRLQAVRGQSDDSQKIEAIRQFTIQADNPDDLDIEAVIWPHASAQAQGILRVRAQIPSRWPDMEGILVKAVAEDWEVEGMTNDQGEVFLEGLPLDALDALELQITP